MKVGDRVVVKECITGTPSYFVGDTGVVKELRDCGPFDLRVRMDDSENDYLFSSDEVEKLEEA